MTIQNETTPSKMRETILATASGGMAIALSTVLSIFKFYPMPQGGSWTPGSMLPLVFCALAFGPVWGLGICAVYGLLQFIIEPYALNIFQVFLDYPLAFAMIGLAGFLAASKKSRLAEKNILHRVGLVPVPRMLLAILVAMTGRFVCHYLAGIIFYASFAPEGQSPMIYSLIYNGSYMLPELILTCVILIPLAAVFRPRRSPAQI